MIPFTGKTASLEKISTPLRMTLLKLGQKQMQEEQARQFKVHYTQTNT